MVCGMGEVTASFIQREQIAKHMGVIKQVCDEMVRDGFNQPTRFEVETTMAMLEFVEQNADFVVLEVGLGGRLDATNVIQTVLCSVITSISMDHMQFLGDTLEAIATEKAGIIKSGVPVVSYDQKDEVKKVLQEVCKEKGSKLYLLHHDSLQIQKMDVNGSTFFYESEEPYYVSLLGRHQVYNAFVAMNVAYVLMEKGVPITDEHVRLGLANTKWFGRFSILEKNPYVIVDGAHNKDAALMLKEALKIYFKKKKGIFVMGVFADKDYEEILKITAPLAKKILTVTTPTDRALPSDQLKEAASKYCREVIDACDVEHALTIAKRLAKPEDYILCFGSLSFLGDVYRYSVE